MNCNHNLEGNNTLRTVDSTCDERFTICDVCKQMIIFKLVEDVWGGYDGYYPKRNMKWVRR